MSVDSDDELAGAAAGDRVVPIQEALVLAMIMTSAADREMHDVELDHIGRLVSELPVFNGFGGDRLIATAKSVTRLLTARSGLARSLATLRHSIPDRLRSTAYLLACEVAVVDRKTRPEELRVMRLLRDALAIPSRTARAIELSTQVRFATAGDALH